MPNLYGLLRAHTRSAGPAELVFSGDAVNVWSVAHLMCRMALGARDAALSVVSDKASPLLFSQQANL